MSINKVILKNTIRQAAVKLIGNGSITITLDELRYPRQYVDVPNAILSITDILFSMQDNGNIVRNGNVVFTMLSGSYQEFNFSKNIGMSIRDDANANLTINFNGSNESTCILQFSKEAGFLDPNQYDIVEGFEDYVDPEYSI